MNTVWYAPGEDYPLSREIREEVFVREQEYPIELEFDEADENCWHLVLTDNEKAIATARLLKLSEGVFKPGRIAVLKEYRGKNIGAELLTLIIEKAKEMARKYDCLFVDNEMPYGRVPQGHPVIVDYFYHEEVRGTKNTGKRNK